MIFRHVSCYYQDSDVEDDGCLGLQVEVVDSNECNNRHEDCHNLSLAENDDDEDWSGKGQVYDTTPKCM